MKNLAHLLFITVLNFGLVHTSFGQAGTLDPNFGNNGIASIVFQSGDFEHFDTEVQADGKIICFGKFFVSSLNGDYPTLVRVNADGSNIDFSYGNNGVRTLSEQVFLSDVYQKLTIDDQGNVYAALTQGSRILVYKVDANGNIVSNYGVGGMVEISSGGLIANLVLQADGKLLIASSSGNDFIITRLNTNGNLDNSFGSNGVVSQSVLGIDRSYDIHIQSDQKILVCGTTDNGFGEMLGVIRLNTDGSLDNSFGNGGKVSRIINGSDLAYGVTTNSTGKVILCGRNVETNFDQKGVIAQFNADGSIDSAFATNGLALIQPMLSMYYFHDLLVQPDGKIVAVGVEGVNGQMLRFALTRLNTDGSLDNSFGSNGSATASLNGVNLRANSVQLDGDNNLIVGGAEQFDTAIRLAKFKTDLPSSLRSSIQDIGIRIYPNPMNEVLMIDFGDSFEREASLEIFTNIGEQAFQTSFQNGGKQQIDLPELSPGLYVGNINIDGKSYSFKLSVK